tara:strand:+ start:121 stop:309 length:189 start_codon:yes stop_codon:yes gene_type:complete
MPDLRIQTAKDNGDLPKDHGQDNQFKLIDEQFKQMFQPSLDAIKQWEKDNLCKWEKDCGQDK